MRAFLAFLRAQLPETRELVAESYDYLVPWSRAHVVFYDYRLVPRLVHGVLYAYFALPRMG